MDNFREWLSDNLRYIMLIGGILILLLLIFFGIRAVSGVINNSDDAKEEQMEASTESATPAPTETPEDPLEKNAYPEVNALICSYYDALGKKDVTTLQTLVDDLDPSEESKIENSQYIDGYSNVEVYTKKGMADDTYVVFAKYNYICTGVDTPVPALSQLYVVKDGDDYKISQTAEEDAKIQAYVSDVLQDTDVQELISETEDAYQQAQNSDPDLKEFLENLGKEVDETETDSDSDSADESAQADAAVATGETSNMVMVTANDYANIRSAPGGDSEIIGVLDEGDSLEKIGEDGLWIIVNYNGQTGYIYNEYVYE